jgi:hypothetical protein
LDTALQPAHIAGQDCFTDRIHHGVIVARQGSEVAFDASCGVAAEKIGERFGALIGSAFD